MTKLATDFKMLIQYINTVHHAYYRRTEWSEIPHTVLRAYPPINETSLENLLQSPRVWDSFARREFVHLEPVRSALSYIPILGFSYDNASDHLRLRVALFSETDEGVAGWGMRFESPEQNIDHAYFHVQPITSFELGSALPRCPAWIPETFPTIPLDARTPAGMAVTLLLCLYGKERLAQERTRLSGKGLGSCFEGIRALS